MKKIVDLLKVIIAIALLIGSIELTGFLASIITVKMIMTAVVILMIISLIIIFKF